MNGSDVFLGVAEKLEEFHYMSHKAEPKDRILLCNCDKTANVMFDGENWIDKNGDPVSPELFFCSGDHKSCGKARRFERG